jgi:hypothetical protein
MALLVRLQSISIASSLVLLALACNGGKRHDTSAGGGAAGETSTSAAGAPGDLRDTLFEDPQVTEIGEGSYLLTGSADGSVELELLLEFQDATEVVLVLTGGAFDAVNGRDVENAASVFQFAISGNRADSDFSRGTFEVDVTVRDLAGDYRLELDATGLAGSEL